MRTQEERENDWQTVQAMKVFGGGFVKALAELFLRADSDNQRRIREAWPEYWEEYSSMAGQQRLEAGKEWWDQV